MKLLLDQNISDRIPAYIESRFPGSCQVKTLNLDCESDEIVWKYARKNDFVILTKDWDFHQMSLVRGFPPKVVFLKIGNCSTDTILSLLERHSGDILGFFDDTRASLLIIEK